MRSIRPRLPTTLDPDPNTGFAVWITGLPSSGKSTLAVALRAQLEARGVQPTVLESDALRPAITPNPSYGEEERDAFYREMADRGALLAQCGVPVIFDATANRRAYRARARAQIPRFLEVYVECPLKTCMSRDPKGIYRKGREGSATAVPGLQAPYEPPANPEVVVRGDQEDPEEAAARVVAELAEKGYLV
jgi:adenylylsulfate kinase